MGKVAILVMWSLTFLLKYSPQPKGVSISNLSSIGIVVSEKTMWHSNMSDLGCKVKGQPWSLELIYNHYLIKFNISRENKEFGYKTSCFKKLVQALCNSIKKSTFQNFPYFNA